MNFNSEHFQNRPHSDEFDPFYSVYVAKVDGNQILGILESQISKICISLSKLTEETAQEVHAPYRWTIKLVLGHLIDGEKVFGYRLLRFASGIRRCCPVLIKGRTSISSTIKNHRLVIC